MSLRNDNYRIRLRSRGIPYACGGVNPKIRTTRRLATPCVSLRRGRRYFFYLHSVQRIWPHSRHGP